MLNKDKDGVSGGRKERAEKERVGVREKRLLKRRDVGSEDGSEGYGTQKPTACLALSGLCSCASPGAFWRLYNDVHCPGEELEGSPWVWGWASLGQIPEHTLPGKHRGTVAEPCLWCRAASVGILVSSASSFIISSKAVYLFNTRFPHL